MHVKRNNFKLIQTSSSEVYGSAKYVPIDENHPMQGQSPYSASKIIETTCQCLISTHLICQYRSLDLLILLDLVNLIELLFLVSFYRWLKIKSL